MKYNFFNTLVDKDNLILPSSDKINSYLLKNNHAEMVKAIDFIDSEEKFLYVHGFLGTGKRQFINYLSEFLNPDVIKLEYYCKQGTVCDDILLSFCDVIDNLAISKIVNLNSKITTLPVKIQQQISSIKKPFLIILHSLDDIGKENLELVIECFSKLLVNDNVKIIVSTRALNPDILGNVKEDRKIFLKAFTKEVFKEYVLSNKIEAADKTLEDFYKYTRGYYYYTALAIKIVQAMNTSLMEFLQKYVQSEMTFDSFIGVTYLNLIPTTIRNFFWFLRTVRHGLTFNALAILELYDEYSIEYLKANLMVFQVDETIYVQDYFLQRIDISIPDKTEIRLHKYIIGIYETQLKEPIKNRAILISRQAMRAEIEYHQNCIEALKQELNGGEEKPNLEKPAPEAVVAEKKEMVDENKFQVAITFLQNKQYTDAIAAFQQVLSQENIDLATLVETRLHLAKLYKAVGNYSNSSHYYELVETYYKQHNELINLNYLYYEMADLYNKMYKNERAVDTIKKVVYSVDTPQSLMVSSCTMLGNIYSEMNNPQDAYSYYKKALDSLDENVEQSTLSELYFKFALANDDKGDIQQALNYYTKCIGLVADNNYRSLAYSNLASCYLDNENYDDALSCFSKAYEIDHNNNSYEGIYYNASNLAKLYKRTNPKKCLEFLIEAKKCAEFLNEPFYIIESTIELGDFYYNNSETLDKSLIEYIKAKKLSNQVGSTLNVSKIESRINDMRLRLGKQKYDEIERKYDK